LIREADEVFEILPPRLPTQVEEDEYIQWLGEDFRKDAWLTTRFRKLTPGPKRIPFKNMKEIHNQHRFTFITHWILGSFLAWPLAVAVGRRQKYYQGGVPIVPYQRFIHDFPKLDPGREARLRFRNWSLIFCVTVGFIFARKTVHNE